MKKLAAELERVMRQAGALALDLRSRLDIRRKPDGSLVTQADTAVEDLLFQKLTELFPGSGFLGEERPVSRFENDDYIWVVDPIDGTDAYQLGLAYWGVSVALVHQGKPILGSFYNPQLDDMYSVRQGRGSFYNGSAICVSQSKELDRNSFVLGPSNFHRRYSLTLPIKLRSLGSTAQHFALVADGRARAVFCQPRIWDVAAGILMVEEAGGVVRQFDGSEVKLENVLQGQPFPQPLIAGYPPICDQLVANICWKKHEIEAD